MSEEKFSKCEERGEEKKYKCGISGVRKKMKEKFRKRKKSKCFLKFEVKDFAKFVFTVGLFVV